MRIFDIVTTIIPFKIKTSDSIITGITPSRATCFACQIILTFKNSLVTIFYMFANSILPLVIIILDMITTFYPNNFNSDIDLFYGLM